MYDDAMYNVDPQSVEGEMTVGASKQKANLGEPDFNTLDEPIRDTIVSRLQKQRRLMFTGCKSGFINANVIFT